jgi:hypothetical protein
MKKKAQMQIAETIFAVIVIIVIIVIGIVFYSKAKEGSIKEQISKTRVDSLISLSHSLSSWPELECSVYESRDFDCFDAVKLEILSETLSKKPVLSSGSSSNASSVAVNSYAFNYYFDLLGRSKIVVRQIYPSSDSKKEWILYESKSISRNADSVVVPISIYYPVERRYAFGVLELKMYE